MGRGEALVALHVAVALFGLAALFGQWIVLPATAIVLGRTVVGAATLALVAALRRQALAPGTRRLAGNGALLAVHWVTFFAAVKIGGVAIALLGYAMFPVFVLLFERDVAHGRRDHVAALLATAGLVAIVPEPSWTNDGTRALGLALISAITFAWLAIRNRRLVAQGSATSIALWQNLFAAACLVPFVILDAPPALPSASDLGGLVVLGVLCTGLAHTLFIASMRHVSAQTASVVAALEPVYGIALAALLLREVPNARTVAGGAVIVAAALVASLHRVGTRKRLSVASKPGTAK